MDKKRNKDLEDVYQDIATLIGKGYRWEIQENKYPQLIIKKMDITEEKYEIIIKPVKRA
jgi:hypothetical protein